MRVETVDASPVYFKLSLTQYSSDQLNMSPDVNIFQLT